MGSNNLVGCCTVVNLCNLPNGATSRRPGELAFMLATLPLLINILQKVREMRRGGLLPAFVCREGEWDALLRSPGMIVWSP